LLQEVSPREGLICDRVARRGGREHLMDGDHATSLSRVFCSRALMLGQL
jgi:hypothetical protein